MGIRNFEEIIAWQEARRLTQMIYSITRKEVFRRDFGLKDQVQRASVSVMANIAEGFGSGTPKEFSKFLSYARRSAMEVQSLLYVALDVRYINENQFQDLYKRSKSVLRLVSKFKSTLDQK